MHDRIEVFIFIMFIFLACDIFDDEITVIDNRIARVGDDILNESKLSQYHGGLVKRETIINKWIETTLMAQAGEKLDGIDLDEIDNKVKNYRKTLLSYEYKKHRLKNMDSVVTNQNILEYYNEKKTTLILEKPIIRCRFLVTNRNLSRNQIKKLESKENSINSKLQDEISDLEGISHLDIEEWVSVESLLNNTPFKKYIENPSLIKINRINIASFKKKYYYLLVFHFKDKGKISPLEYNKKKIIRSILLGRKKKMLKTIKEGLQKEARKNKKIEIY